MNYEYRLENTEPERSREYENEKENQRRKQREWLDEQTKSEKSAADTASRVTTSG